MTLALTSHPALESPEVALVDLQAPLGDVFTPRPAAPAAELRARVDIVEEWGMQSFPASDPPSNW